VLRIDLLPRRVPRMQRNKWIIFGICVLLVAEVLATGGWYLQVQRNIGTTQDQLAETKKKADKVRDIEGKTQQKQGDLAPIAQKVDFVAAADQSGAQYWDRFHAINAYIYEKAQVTRFSITNPDQVNFEVIVGDTTEAARFVLNLIQCPSLDNISISGLPPGVSIEGVGGRGAAGFTPMGGPEMGMMDDEAFMEEEPGMGIPGAPGGMRRGAAAAPGDIALSINATLTEPVSEPMPTGGAAAPGGGRGGGPMEPGPGMGPMPDEMGMEEEMMPE